MHNSDHADIRTQLDHLVEHFEHILPAQASIKDFVHHNTLHGFQHLPFKEALKAACEVTGASAWMPEARSREFYAQGRITRADLEAVLQGLPEFANDRPLCGGVTRNQVLLCGLLYPFKRLSRSQLRWQVEEMAALTAFQADVPVAARERLCRGALTEAALSDLWAGCLAVLELAYDPLHPEELTDISPEEIEALAEQAVNECGMSGASAELAASGRLIGAQAHRLLDQLIERVGSDWTLRSLLLALSGEDLLDDLRPLMIRLIASHLDQGLAAWHSPRRELGFYAAWRAGAERDPQWMFTDLPEWRSLLERLPDDPLDAVMQELRLLDLPEQRWAGYLERLALEIPGWSGMTLWRHTHPGYAGLSAPVAMMDFLAVRLILERLFAQRLTRRHWRIEASLSGLRWYFHHYPAELWVRHALFDGRLPEYLVSLAQRQMQEAIQRKEEADNGGWEKIARLLWAWRETPSADQRGGVNVAGDAWQLYRLAQHLGLSGDDLRAAGRAGAEQLLACLSALDTDQRGYIWLNAYERHYREEIFSALAANHGRGPWAERAVLPQAQLVFCMDDREEGMRRHLEETNRRLETFGAAAHYSVFMNWYGLDDHEPTVLCPVVARPAHEVRELARSGAEALLEEHRARRATRLTWKERLHQGSRRGLLSAAATIAVAAPGAALALAGKVLAPGRLGLLGESLRQAFDKEVPTRIAFSAANDSPPATPDAPRADGYTDLEQTDRVQAFLRNIGLTDGFAPLVVIVGHGSNSQNNPHLAAYDCGACSGRHSGPNGRLFAAMANRPQVRALLSERGIVIPPGSWFLGCEHNTCDDAITWYDLEDLPVALRDAHIQLDGDLAAAARAHAQERCRRLASAPLGISQEDALQHVIGRRHDFSQARPELGHATNACAFIGRRSMSRGAFFDRRSFLISYDPTRDPDGKVLEGLLLANGPVGAGISLEYYFSTVNNEQYGCGTKIVHNVTGFLGVMEGAASDLRTGLPRQMIEIHEAMRLLVVVEAKIDIVTAIYLRQPPLQELIGNGWLVVGAKDPDGPDIHLFDPAQGWLPWQGKARLPGVERSSDWFTGKREPLPPVLLTLPIQMGEPA